MDYPLELILFLKKITRIAVLTGVGTSQENGLCACRNAILRQAQATRNNGASMANIKRLPK